MEKQPLVFTRRLIVGLFLGSIITLIGIYISFVLKSVFLLLISVLVFAFMFGLLITAYFEWLGWKMFKMRTCGFAYHCLLVLFT